MKIGLIIGSASGKGYAPEAMISLVPRLQSHDVAICAGPFGCDSPPSSWSRLSTEASASYVENLRSSVASLLDWGSDMLICIGGDGLASYVLDAIISRGKKLPLLGIGSGTINVGPIIAFRTEDIPMLDISKLSVKTIDAVEVSVDGKHLAYALNDAIIGNSFLGMLEGRVVNLSAKALLDYGRKLEIEPSPHIARKDFCISKNGLRIENSMQKPAQIIVSPLRKREFFARAIAGVLCNASYMDGAAALGLFDTVIVRAATPLRGFENMELSEHLLFGPKDFVEIEGLSRDGDIVVDGNPFHREGEVVSFKLRIDVAEVLVPRDHNSEPEGVLCR